MRSDCGADAQEELSTERQALCLLDRPILQRGRGFRNALRLAAARVNGVDLDEEPHFVVRSQHLHMRP